MEFPVSLAKKCAAYAFAGTAVGVPAAAAPIYVNPPDVTYTSNTSVGFDINDDGTNDYQLVLGAGSAALVGSWASAEWEALGSNSVAVDRSWPTGYDIIAFHEGDVVGPNLDYRSSSYGLLATSKNGVSGDWPNNLSDPLFVGLRLSSGGQVHYGWARIGVSAQRGDHPQAQGIVYDWAYESNPNTAITISVPSAEIPEPSSFALLALGALGIVALRKRARD